MLKKITIPLLGFTIWLFGVPIFYPMDAVTPKNQTEPMTPIEPIDSIAPNICVVHPIGEEYDLNLDGVVDETDIMNVANVWSSKLYQKRYNPAYNFNSDNIIDIYDIMILASKWGIECQDLYPKKEE